MPWSFRFRNYRIICPELFMNTILKNLKTWYQWPDDLMDCWGTISTVWAGIGPLTVCQWGCRGSWKIITLKKVQLENFPVLVRNMTMQMKSMWILPHVGISSVFQSVGQYVILFLSKPPFGLYCARLGSITYLKDSFKDRQWCKTNHKIASHFILQRSTKYASTIVINGVITYNPYKWP